MESDNMKIEIWSDFACPFCYIGKKRFEKALESFPHKDQVEVVYKSFILDPNAPKETTLSGVEELAKSKGIEVKRAKEMYDHVVRMAKTEGLNYNMEKMQATSTNDAHRLLMWANTLGMGKEVSDKFFEAYFIKGLNVANYDTLVKLVEELGMDGKRAREILEFGEYEINVEQDLNDARMLGVQSVPTFVINREFGISGAQREEYFLNVLNDTYNKMSKIEIKTDDTACGPDGCDF